MQQTAKRRGGAYHDTNKLKIIRTILLPHEAPSNSTARPPGSQGGARAPSVPPPLATALPGLFTKKHKEYPVRVFNNCFFLAIHWIDAHVFGMTSVG